MSTWVRIRDEVRTEVLEEAKAENWAQPNEIPTWTKHIQISGDVRLRDEYDLYSKHNANDIINFAALNANGPTMLRRAVRYGNERHVFGRSGDRASKD